MMVAPVEKAVIIGGKGVVELVGNKLLKKAVTSAFGAGEKAVIRSEVKGAYHEGMEFLDDAIRGSDLNQPLKAANADGGLNLFKWGADQTTQETGWKIGDYMLNLPDKGTPKLNWKANYGALRREMKLGKPIFDSFRSSGGKLLPSGGFLNAERSILKEQGWIYNSGNGAWMPPKK